MSALAEILSRNPVAPLSPGPDGMAAPHSCHARVVLTGLGLLPSYSHKFSQSLPGAKLVIRGDVRACVGEGFSLCQGRSPTTEHLPVCARIFVPSYRLKVHGVESTLVENINRD